MTRAEQTRAEVSAESFRLDILARRLWPPRSAAEKILTSGADFCRAVEQFKKVHAQLPQALADLENRVEDSRPMTQQLEATKSRLLGLLPSDASELVAQPSAQRVHGEHEAAHSQHASAKAEAEACWRRPLLRRGLELRTKTQMLTQRMDEMLAPFIRISQSIKGKGDQDRIGKTSQTATLNPKP